MNAFLTCNVHTTQNNGYCNHSLNENESEKKNKNRKIRKEKKNIKNFQKLIKIF